MTLGRIYDLWGRTKQVIAPRPEPHPLLLDDDEGEALRATMAHFHGGRFGVPASKGRSSTTRARRWTFSEGRGQGSLHRRRGASSKHTG